MAVIKANKVELEVIKQNIPGAAAKYLISLSYEPMRYQSKEVVSLILCNETPYISMLEETENTVTAIQKTGPSLTPPPEIKTAEQLFGMDATVEELREAADDADYQDLIKGRLTPEDLEWRTKK